MEKGVAMGGALYYVVILGALLGCVGVLVLIKKKQAGSSPAAASKGPQRGIIK